jgi:hypothetical protein
MLNSIRSHISYANVTATLALFFALAGGSAYAINEWNSSNIQNETLLSEDIKNGTLKTDDVKNESLTGFDIKDGWIGQVDLADGTVNSAKVADNSLTGADIKDGWLTGFDIENSGIGQVDLADRTVNSAKVADNSLTGSDINESTLVGVSDRCHAGALLFGRLCAGGGATGNVYQALNTCGSIGMRLPTWSEAIQLAANHDVPGLGAPPEQFWTDEVVILSSGDPVMVVVDENGIGAYWADLSQKKIVCVETPNNLP